MTIRKSKQSIKYLEKLAGKLTLGSLLLAVRLAEEMSQTDFSQKLGVSKQYLCDLEQERRFISPKSAALYANILGYSESQFVRLCLQDMIDRDGLHFIIDVRDAA